MSARLLLLLPLAAMTPACRTQNVERVADSVRLETPGLWTDAELASYLRVVAFTLMRDADLVRLRSRSVPVTTFARDIAAEQRRFVAALDSLPQPAGDVLLPHHGAELARDHGAAFRDSTGRAFDLAYVGAVRSSSAAVLAQLNRADSELRARAMAPLLGRARIMMQRELQEAKRLDAVLRRPRPPARAR